LDLSKLKAQATYQRLQGIDVNSDQSYKLHIEKQIKQMLKKFVSKDRKTNHLEIVTHHIMNRLTESEIRRITRKIISENRKESTWEKIKRKLKGISDDQLIYNMENDLPWDWKGSKEGFYEKNEPRKNSKGSN
jgi:Glu-tRNA(Gln) amidotransferase subunit E-like FAD-binding protein